MAYIAGALMLLFVFGAMGRRARQAQLLASLRRNFIAEAKQLLATVPASAPMNTDDNLGAMFDRIYEGLLERFGARDFADLLRKGQTSNVDPEIVTSEVCREAVDAWVRAQPSRTLNEEARLLVPSLLSVAMSMAGRDMYAEAMGGG